MDGIIAGNKQIKMPYLNLGVMKSKNLQNI